MYPKILNVSFFTFFENIIGATLFKDMLCRFIIDLCKLDMHTPYASITFATVICIERDCKLVHRQEPKTVFKHIKM